MYRVTMIKLIVSHAVLKYCIALKCRANQVYYAGKLHSVPPLCKVKQLVMLIELLQSAAIGDIRKRNRPVEAGWSIWFLS